MPFFILLAFFFYVGTNSGCILSLFAIHIHIPRLVLLHMDIILLYSKQELTTFQIHFLDVPSLLQLRVWAPSHLRHPLEVSVVYSEV